MGLQGLWGAKRCCSIDLIGDTFMQYLINGIRVLTFASRPFDQVRKRLVHVH